MNLKTPDKTPSMAPKILIIRFSSFGDIAHALSCVTLIKSCFDSHDSPQLHWVVRQDFSPILKAVSDIDQVWSIPRGSGLQGIKDLWKLGLRLRQEKFSHVYDAHSNLRSHILSFILKPLGLNQLKLVRRSKERLRRILLFGFRINTFTKPFVAQDSYVGPLLPWLRSKSLSETKILRVPRVHFQGPHNTPLSENECLVILAPSAAWDLKKWPLQHWKDLIALLPDHWKIAIVGGPEDLFCGDLAQIPRPTKTLNFAGHLSWVETCAVIQKASLVISGDTGVLHMADLLGVPAVGLVGPTAFGYPSQPTSKVVEVEVSCKPCTKDGRGRCNNSLYQRCLVEIDPKVVLNTALSLVKTKIKTTTTTAPLS